MSFVSGSCSPRGSSIGSSHSRPGSYEVSRCSACVAVSMPRLYGRSLRRACHRSVTVSLRGGVDFLQAVDDQVEAELERAHVPMRAVGHVLVTVLTQIWKGLGGDHLLEHLLHLRLLFLAEGM